MGLLLACVCSIIAYLTPLCKPQHRMVRAKEERSETNERTGMGKSQRFCARLAACDRRQRGSQAAAVDAAAEARRASVTAVKARHSATAATAATAWHAAADAEEGLPPLSAALRTAAMVSGRA